MVNFFSIEIFKFCIFSKKYERQIEEHILSSNNDDREISLLTNQCRKLQNEIDALKEQFDVGNEKISELKRKNVKAESEMKLWRTKLENDAMPKIDEIEDENAKLRSKYDMNEKALVEFEAKILLLKKQKNKLLEDAKQSKDEAENERRKLEEKMKKLKEVLTLNEKLKIQIEDLKQDIESSRRHNILCNNELSQVKHENSNLQHQVDLLKNEAENHQSKITKQAEDLLLMEGKILDIESQKKKFEIEKDDLTLALEDLEFSLEKANVKNDAQLREFEKNRSEMEQRLDDKEIEMKTLMERLQNQLDAEKSKLCHEQKTCIELKRWI